MKLHRLISGILPLILFVACSAEVQDSPKPAAVSDGKAKARITFVELGSVKCIPCKQMQPVMESIASKYGDQIEVVFYDVWEPDQKHFAQQYKVRMIPTQVFLDINGSEINRHEGFYPETEIDEFLLAQGLEIKISSDGP